MKHEAKSVLIGRKKNPDGEEEGDVRPCFVSLFDHNNPHLSEIGPEDVLEFSKVHKVILNGLKVNYLLPGNDIVLNNLKSVTVEEEGKHLIISGEQE